VLGRHPLRERPAPALARSIAASEPRAVCSRDTWDCSAYADSAPPGSISPPSRSANTTSSGRTSTSVISSVWRASPAQRNLGFVVAPYSGLAEDSEPHAGDYPSSRITQSRK
jgi:hypothetical protein